MFEASLNSLLESLEVKIEAFAVCEIGEGHALRVAPLDQIVVHYVLQGEGSIECEQGTFPIRRGDIAIIPRQFPKQINGSGRTTVIEDADHSCPLSPGIVKYRSCRMDGTGLILGCASASASVGAGLGLFDRLQQPLVQSGADGTLTFLFETILRELSDAGLGTKVVVESLMKPILVQLLRNHLKGAGTTSHVYLPLLHPQLGRALNAMVARPQDPHSVDSLAALAGMSRSRFVCHFVDTYGASPMHFLQALRLRTAARLLSVSAMPVKSLAVAVGFASRSHFSRAFRNHFGADPTAFRSAAIKTRGMLEQVE